MGLENNVSNSAGRGTAKNWLDGSGSSSSSGGGSGGGNGGKSSSTGSTSQGTKIVDLTAEAEAKGIKPVENIHNDYTQYWDGVGINDRRITGNTPEVHIYISRQMLDAEQYTRDSFDVTKLIQNTDTLKNNQDVNTSNTAIYKDGSGEQIIVHQSIEKLND